MNNTHCIKRPFITLVAALCLSLANSASYADFDKGLDAFDRQDYTTAFEHFKDPAEQGNVYAQSYLGNMYANGQGVVKNEQIAVEWFQKAAEQDSAEAQYILGLMYANGKGVVKNESTALEWYTKAAEQGLAEAQYALGLMYTNGQGVVKDYQTAYFWALLASADGDEDTKRATKKIFEITEKELTPQQKQTAQNNVTQWQSKY